MYMLTGKNENEETVILDDRIPNDYAHTHNADYMGQFYPKYHGFVLTQIERGESDEK